MMLLLLSIAIIVLFVALAKFGLALAPWILPKGTWADHTPNEKG